MNNHNCVQALSSPRAQVTFLCILITITSSTATLWVTANIGSGVHTVAFTGVPFRRRYRSINNVESFPTFLSPFQCKKERRKLSAAAHTKKNDNDASMPTNTTDLRGGDVKNNQYKKKTAETSIEYNSEITTETQLDYVGAGTLGDIMSLPDDDGEVSSPNMSSAMTDQNSAQKQQPTNNAFQDPTAQLVSHPHWTSNLTESDISHPPPSSLNQEKDSTSSTDTIQHNPVKPSPSKSGLVTSAGGTLTSRFAHISPKLNPLDRIALTANGNLQRIFSSYYDSPVFVHVDVCAPRKRKKILQEEEEENKKGGGEVEMRMVNGDVPTFLASSLTTKNGKRIKKDDKEGVADTLDDDDGKYGGDGADSTTPNSSSCVKNVDDNNVNVPTVWDRIVHLSVHDQRFCTAASVITVYSQECKQLVESGKVGLGQLFRYLDKLPTFELLDAGRTEEGGLWRRYELSCSELKCDVKEVFVPDAWDIDGLPSN